MNILIVEDEVEVRETLRDLLEDEGHCVKIACNGAEAMAALAVPDAAHVVILDLIMPVMSGNEVYAAMQEEPGLASIPVLVTTSDPSRAPRGAPVLRKPVNLDRLLEALRHLDPAVP